MSTTDPKILADLIGCRVRAMRTATPPPKARPAGQAWHSCMTVEELPTAAGVARNALTSIELGKQVPKLETLAALADALECDLSAFLPERKPGPKSEPLAELMFAAERALSAMAIRRLARQVKAMRGDGDAAVIV